MLWIGFSSVFILDFTFPDVKIKLTQTTLNRTVNGVVGLTCIVQGQPGITINWIRNGKIIHSSSLEVNETIYPSHRGIFGMAVSNLTIRYNYDQEIHENFKCTNLNKSKPRELYCYANYECSASYPGGNPRKKTASINVAPNMSKWLYFYESSNYLWNLKDKTN